MGLGRVTYFDHEALFSLNMLSTHVIVLRCVGPDSLGSLAMTTTMARKRLLKSESTLF